MQERIRSWVLSGMKIGGRVPAWLVLVSLIVGGRAYAVAPVVSNLPPVAVTETTAVLRGNMVTNGGFTTTAYFYMGTSNGGTTAANWSRTNSAGVVTAGVFSNAVAGLTPGTTYYFRAFATNSTGSAWAPSSDTFDTPATTTTTSSTTSSTTSTTTTTTTTTTTSTAPYWRGLGTDSYWQNPTNWSYLPNAGEQLRFPATQRTANTNNFPANTAFSGFVFHTAGSFILDGNAVNLTGDIINSIGNPQVINLPLVLTGGSRRFVSDVGDLTVNGAISGGWGMIKSGAQLLALNGVNMYSGDTLVSNGTLRLGGALSPSSRVIVESGGRLAGTGRAAGEVRINAGATLSPGMSVGTITNGSLILEAGSTNVFEFNGTPDNDRIIVTNLNGLTINGGGVLLYGENTTSPWTVEGSYQLIQYSGTAGGAGPNALTVLNPHMAFQYTFATNGGWVVLEMYTTTTTSTTTSTTTTTTISTSTTTTTIPATTTTTSTTTTSTSSTTASVVVATQAAAGYRAGETNWVQATVSYPPADELWSLLWRPELPAGWALVDGTNGAAGDGSPEVRSGEIVFMGDLSANPVQFAFKVIVPGGQTGVKNLAGDVEYQLDGMINPATLAAMPDPLPLERRLILMVQSQYGGAWPGTVTTNYGVALAQWVLNSPVTLGGSTQYVCAGAAVTGNAYTPVNTTNVTLTLTNDATLAWQWTTNYALTLATAGPGAVDRTSGFYAFGSNVVIAATASNHYHFAGWSGDTNGCVLAGAQLTAPMTGPRAITATFAIDDHTLTVQSQYGGAWPGTVTTNYGAALAQWVLNSPVTLGGSTQYVCAGAAVTGNEYTPVNTTNVTLTLTNDATLAWQWKTQFWLEAYAATAGGDVTANNGWHDQGSNLLVTAVASNGYHFSHWSGDTQGDTNSTAMNLTMTGPRTLTAHFAGDQADLGISKTITGGSPIAGTSLQYTIAVSNNGPQTAQNVQVQDLLSWGVTTSNLLTKALGNLAAGVYTSYLFTVQINADTLGAITNRVVVTSDTPDPGPTTNAASALSTVTGSADLGVTKTVSGGSTTAGEQLLFAITLTNSGPSVARAVTITDTAFPGLTAIDGAVTNFGDLAVGFGTSYTFRALIDADALGSVSNRAAVTSTTSDPGPLPNAALALSSITNAADVGIRKEFWSGVLKAGTELTHRIVVSNNGPSVARGVVVTDTPGAGLTAVDNVSSNLGNLAANAVTSYLFRVWIHEATLGTITNRASVTTTTTDPNALNNDSAATNPVSAEADISLTKLGPPTGAAGSNLTYTIIVSNAGPSLAQSVVWTDSPPASVTALDPTGGTLGNLSANAATSFLFRAQVLAFAEGPITNTASATAATTDPAPGNNTDTHVVDIGAASYTIQASAGPGGSVSPNGTVSIAYGRSTNVTVTASLLYHITDVRVDGSSVGTFGQGSNVMVYAFSNVTTNHTIAATFGIDAGLVGGLHTASSYAAMATNTINCAFTNFTGQSLQDLRWAPALPPGWALGSASGQGGPSVTNGTSIVFAAPASTNPLSFSYTVVVPFGQQGSNQITGTLSYRLAGMVSNETVTVDPNPLWLYAYHVADFRDARALIDGTELNSVLTYWRNGAYHITNAASADGYAQGAAGDTNGQRHVADYQPPFWSVDGSEANRVLAYWRAMGYRVDAAGYDGYAAGTGSFFRAGMALNGVSALHVAATGQQFYDPGRPVTLTFALSVSGELLALGWKPLVPDGWQLVDITADGKPEVRRGEAVWVGRLPPSPVSITCTLLPPLNAHGSRTIRGVAEVLVSGLSNPQSSDADGDSIQMVMRDADGDRLADTWESLYGGDVTSMNPLLDLDGDGMDNYAESVAGTDPTDPDSRLAVAAGADALPGDVVLAWPGIEGRLYRIERADAMALPFLPIVWDIPGTPPLNAYTDRVPEARSLYYRVEVQNEP